ncbi:exodeoxyribonuclease V subunit gamma [Candidatus Profftia sp. (ex Adelges kitamiensis)]|uniref:exodeoxyribonuclease V subunit gamma n=1 Tax=Candidatus Profftia sp. (ex Adelges kitamiensis) TaxID=2864218 RepID=UPI001CE2A191|nr:exodeoxyribonuclease V subunit gamma [Candidatus Profftia sp. (ex Adelges kitamiensis)]
MFTVYHSNKLYLLKQIIADLMIQEPLQNFFEQEIILVQRFSIAQWLEIELAKQLGIAANIKFFLYNTFIWNLCTKNIIGVTKENYFSTEVMAWKIMSILSQMRGHKEFRFIDNYLSNDQDPRKCFQLASCIADLYTQYLVYRPLWIYAWERGEQVKGLNEYQQWQAFLWMMLKKYTVDIKQSKWHYANLYKQCISILENAVPSYKGLPKRIFICGSPSFPPIYLDILKALGRHIDVHMMLINPCRYYWGNKEDYIYIDKLQNHKFYRYIESNNKIGIFNNPKRGVKLFNYNSKRKLNNTLLESWGKLGSNYMYLLAQYNLKEVHTFVDLYKDTLLTRIQKDILELEDYSNIINSIEDIKNRSNKRLLNLGDRSISVNLCHNLQREVEVLYDRLLNIFSKERAIMLRDVIVMAVNIENYKPYIKAVFGNAPPDRYLPFFISDNNIRHTHQMRQTFLMLLNLPESRMTSEDILTLLELPDLALHFGISEEELCILRHWINESGVRWGLNNDNVRELNLPITNQHTWQFGLTRMLLGYSMDSNLGDFNGVLPYDESSGCDAKLIGQLADFIMKLNTWRIRLSNEYRISEWQPLYREILNDFFVQNSENQDVQNFIEQQWLKMINEVINAEYSHKIPISLIREKFILYLDNKYINNDFLAGSINFCNMMSMSSIPFKVVCLLGMNDDIYPYTTTALSFDLMISNIQIGDHDCLKDNRYLFLEALVSAQEYFYISYISYSLTDNKKRYPSVMLSELVEYISHSHYMSGDESVDIISSAKKVKEYLQIQHPRVPFAHENYIIGSEIQSYNSEWLPAALGIGKARKDFSSQLIMEDFSVITLDEIISFYRNPVRAFFQMRLGVNFKLGVTKKFNEEPFTLNDLNRYHLNNQLLNYLIIGNEIEILFRRFCSAGILPYGSFGQVYWNKEQKRMKKIAVKVKQHIQPQNVIEIDEIIGGIRITGCLKQVQNNGLLRWSPSILGVVDGISLWIEHLFYCWSGGKGNSRYFGNKNSEWHFANLLPKNAEKILLILLESYRQGRSYPLLLLPKTSWAWLNACFDKCSGLVNWNDQIQAKAKVKYLLAWHGDHWQIGERYNPYIQRVIPNLDHKKIYEIKKCAELYYLPLIQNNLAK